MRNPNYISSAAHRDQAREAIKGWNARRANLPRCGAKRRNGEPCRGWPLANGRCRHHGGTVPKGDKWHRAQFPSKKSKVAERKTRMKLEKLQYREAKRLERVALMTPEQREKHERRRAALKGGPAAQRLAAKLEAKNNAAARAIMAAAPQRPAPADPAYQAIVARLAELRALQARAEAPTDTPSEAPAEPDNTPYPNIGVFG